MSIPVIVIVRIPIAAQKTATPTLASRNCKRVGPRVYIRRTVPILNSPPAEDPIKMIINIVPALSATCMARLNDVGRRSGSEALRRAFSLNCVACAVEGGGQFAAAWPWEGVRVGGQGALELSRGAFRTKKVLSENKRKTSIAMTIAL